MKFLTLQSGSVEKKYFNSKLILGVTAIEQLLKWAI